MKFNEIVASAKELLQRRGRITYRGLAREFGLDDAALRDLAEELIAAERVAADEGGKVLVWIGAADRAFVAAEGERRQLTVMFCDLVGSTTLSEQIDPEELRELVSAYQQEVRRVVQRYDGFVAQYLGDGVLAYFGYPVAHEDDAVRGVRAGLDLLARLRELKTRWPVEIRIGMHTGPSVVGAVGDSARGEQLAMGRTPNLAAGVQGAALPGTLAITGDTYRLVQGLFDCEALGPQRLKGIAEPVPLFEVRQARLAANRFDVKLEQGLSPLQGRERELDALLRQWHRACAGEGRVVLIRGEAGIGKSRLTRALGQRVAQDGLPRLVFQCSPFHTGTPLHPMVEHLGRLLQDVPPEAPGDALQALRHLLEPAGMLDDSHLALFATLLSIPLPEGHPEPGLSRGERKARTLQALASWLLRLAEARPTLVVFEDLQWADPSTLEMLSLGLGQLQGAAILLVLTCRPEFTVPWARDASFVELNLARLLKRDVRHLAAQIAGKPLPREVVEQLVRKTDGVPLYVEEMTRDLLESNLLRESAGRFVLQGAMPPMAVPFSLQDSLTSRLDRLGSARHLAQTASVLGREFRLPFLRALADMDEQILDGDLQRLCDADILVRRDRQRDTVYIFRHALIQDAAYNSLLIRHRQHAHARVAELLSTEWAQMAEQQPALVAHHYTEAGLVEPAIDYWQRAGLRAVEGSANKEAIQHVSMALEILKRLPEGRERDRKELTLLMALGVPLAVTTSWVAPEVRRANERAFKLCEALGEESKLFPVMYGVLSDRQVQADYDAARPIARQLLALAQRSGDDGFLLQAHRAEGILRLHTGEFLQALEHCDAGWALYRPDRHHGHVLTYWLDPGVGCLCYGGWALAFLGRHGEALVRMNQAIDLARSGGHAFSYAYALHFCAVLHQLRREPGPTRERALELTVLAREHGFPALHAWATMMLGCAQVEEGAPRAGIEQIRAGEQALRSRGSRLARSGALALLAEALARCGRTEPGLAAATEALEFVAQTGERFYEAELHRLRGELLLQRGKGAVAAQAQLEARECFARSLDIAGQQGAAIWTLRAATSLARQHGSSDAGAQDRERLASVLAQVAPDAAMKDVREARAASRDAG